MSGGREAARFALCGKQLGGRSHRPQAFSIRKSAIGASQTNCLFSDVCGIDAQNPGLGLSIEIFARGSILRPCGSRLGLLLSPFQPANHRLKGGRGRITPNSPPGTFGRPSIWRAGAGNDPAPDVWVTAKAQLLQVGVCLPKRLLVADGSADDNRGGAWPVFRPKSEGRAQTRWVTTHSMAAALGPCRQGSEKPSERGWAPASGLVGATGCDGRLRAP
jgi:hypothetical protein